MSEHDSVHDLAAAYALDAIDGDERARFEAHYPTCPTCRREVEEFTATATLLALSEAVEPPAALKDAVMDQVRSTRQHPPIVAEPISTEPIDELAVRRGRRRLWPMAAAAAVVFVATVGIGLVLSTMSDRTVDEPFALLLETPDVVITELDGDGGDVTVAWSPSRDEVGVRGSDLAEVDDGEAYALWLLTADGPPVPAGLFVPDDGEVITVGPVDDVDSVGWGITIEPEQGSEQPTSEIIFSGST